MESVIKTHAFDSDFVVLEQMSVMYSVTTSFLYDPRLQLRRILILLYLCLIAYFAHTSYNSR
jgi:hypothetical protein